MQHQCSTKNATVASDTTERPVLSEWLRRLPPQNTNELPSFLSLDDEDELLPGDFRGEVRLPGGTFRASISK